MTETIKSLATKIDITTDCLIKQFDKIGIKKNKNDSISIIEKKTLLNYLNKKQDTSKQQIKLTIQRKTRSTLNVPIIGGKSKLINIEVRKKRTYINRITDEIKTEEFKEYELKESSKIENEIKEKSIENIIKNKININIKDEITNKKIHLVNKKEKNKKNEYNQKIEKTQKNNIRHINNLKNKTELNRINEKNTKTLEERNNIRNYNDKKLNHNHYINYNYNILNENDKNEKEKRHLRNRSNKIIRNKKKNNKFSEKIYKKEEHAISRLINNPKEKQRKNNFLQQVFTKPVSTINKNVIIGETITIRELANKMAIKSSQVIKTMIKMGAMATINQIIDQETAQLVVEEMGHNVILRKENELEESILKDRDIGVAIQKPRAPIVTIMGHVDHGKTSLLDYIRSTKIAHKEAGGITQHIGAYHVKTKKGIITFLDTPGHAAFTSMRSRGTKVTDIVVLVVAADDGVMPQTIEAIQHAKAANVPIIVAINKIDKVNSNPDRIKNELSKYDIIPECWGGKTQFIEVSAKKGIGIDILLDSILIQAKILELKTIYTGMARGVVIESYLDKGRGPVATILVQEGTLNKGDIILCGFEYGRIRAMRDEFGKDVKSAEPSIPIEIFGLSNIPSAGDKASVVRDEKKAREVALYRQGKFRDIKLDRQQKSKLKNIFSNTKENKISELNIILKTDVQGICEAIKNSLKKLSNDKVKIKIIFSGVGNITETDATLAIASNAIILGFNVKPETSAKRFIENENINFQYYSVIYNLIDDIKQSMLGMIKPEYKHKIIGIAKVKNIFKSTKSTTIAGCIVIEGIINRNNLIHILRNDIIIHEGEIESLRRFKDDVNEVYNGTECGIGIKNFNNICINDIIKVLKVIEIKHSINN